jgi:hypothetical protein
LLANLDSFYALPYPLIRPVATFSLEGNDMKLRVQVTLRFANTTILEVNNEILFFTVQRKPAKHNEVFLMRTITAVTTEAQLCTPALPAQYRFNMIKFLPSFLVFFLSLCVLDSSSAAENIDPASDGSQYAYSENSGWLDGEPLGNGGPGLEVQKGILTGYIWGENIGWINLHPAFGGVVNDGKGRLSGFAWGENIGWINFQPTDGGVTIAPKTGVFSGFAWGENIGWIQFNSPSTPAFQMVTSWRNTFPWVLFYPGILRMGGPQ